MSTRASRAMTPTGPLNPQRRHRLTCNPHRWIATAPLQVACQRCGVHVTETQAVELDRANAAAAEREVAS